MLNQAHRVSRTTRGVLVNKRLLRGKTYLNLVFGKRLKMKMKMSVPIWNQVMLACSQEILPLSLSLL
jgi:hypothetical protein